MSLLKFLYEVGDVEVQLQIKREINGEAADTDDDDDDDDDEEEMEEDDSDDRTAVRRIQSPTLWGILKRYYTDEIPAAATDWSCFLSFFKATVHQLDIKDTAIMDGYLRTLSDFILYSNRILSKSLRNNFSNVVRIGKIYYAAKYGVNSKKFNDVIENHWRPVLKVSKDVLQLQMKMKMDEMLRRANERYELDWDTYQSVLIRYSQSLYKNDYDFTTTDAIQLIICIQACIACRKTEVLDPIIEFHTYTAWRQRLDETGAPQTNFIFGDNDGIRTISTDVTMKEFQEQNIIVQIGKLKDSNQRLLPFGDKDGVLAALSSTNVIIRKPSLIFKAKDICLMVAKVRKYFGLNKSTRGTDIDARRKIGALVQSRDVRAIMVRDWPSVMAHARKHNFRVGTHFFRASAACFMLKVFEDKIRIVTGRSMYDEVIMKTFLAHEGSLESTLSYKYVDAKLPIPRAALETPNIHLIRTMQDRQDFLEQELRELKELLKKQPVAVRQEDGMAEFSVNGNSFRLAKYKRKTVYRDQKQRDETMNHYAQVLTDNGLPVNPANMYKMGFGKSTVAAWANKKPLGWTPSNDKQSAPIEVEEKEVRILRNTATTVDLNQLPAGDKIIGFDPKDKKNTQNTQLKRNIEMFGEENVIPPSECEGWKTKKRKFTTDKNIVIERLVCDNPRI